MHKSVEMPGISSFAVCVYVLVLLGGFCSSGGVLAQPYGGPDTLWTRVLLFPELYFMNCRDMVQLADGGFMISGHQTIEDPYEDRVYLMRLDNTGSVVWRQPYDLGLAASYSGQMCQLDSNRFAVSGLRIEDEDFSVFITDANGTVVRNETYVRPFRHIPSDILRTRDGGMIIVGLVVDTASGLSRITWMKTDSAGNAIWEGNSSLSAEYLYAESGAETPDGGIVVTGKHVLATEAEAVLIRVNNLGGVVFEREYHLRGFTNGHDVVALADGGYVMCGDMLVGENPNYHWLPFAWRLNIEGDSLWCWAGGEDEYLGEGSPVAFATPDGGFIVHTTTVVFSSLTRLTSVGQVLWHHSYPLGDPYTYGASWHCFERDALGRYAFAGQASGGGLVGQIAIVKTQPDSTALGNVGSNYPSLASEWTLTIFPNPFNSTAHIEFMLPVTQRVSLRLYDVLGRKVAVLAEGVQLAGYQRVSLDGAGMASGVYFARLDAGGMSRTQKMVLLR